MPKESFNISFYGKNLQSEFLDVASKAIKDEAYPKIVEVMKSSAVKTMREIVDDIAKKSELVYHRMYKTFIVTSSILIVICFTSTILLYFWPVLYYPCFEF